jgi:hypothetical protein
MGHDPSSENEPAPWGPDDRTAAGSGGNESATWSPNAFEPVNELDDQPENAADTWTPDEQPTMFEPMEPQRTMALEEPQAWSMEPTYVDPAPWAQTEHAYTRPPPPQQPPPQYMPPYVPPPPPPPRSGSTGKMVAIAVAAVAAIAVIVVVTVLALRSGSKDNAKSGDTSKQGSSGTSGKSSQVTKCNVPPSFSMVDAKTDPSGLTVKLRVKAGCAGGDVLSSPDTTIAIGASDGSVDVASGRFDLSGKPLFVPRPADGTADQQFVFGTGTYWMPLGMFDGKYTASSPGYRVQLSQSGSPATTSGTANGSSPGTFTATGPAQPLSGDADTAAGNALHAIAEADMPIIKRDLEDKWIPQLSSKRIGLVFEGTDYDNTAILREHLDLRRTYPNVRLTWTGDWTSYRDKDWWVTSTGTVSPTADGALSWCTDHGLDYMHCFAKRISTTLPFGKDTEQYLPH